MTDRIACCIPRFAIASRGKNDSKSANRRITRKSGRTDHLSTFLNDLCNGGVVRLAVTYLQFPIQVCFSATIGHPMQQSLSSGFLL